ncbi:DNA helicase/exodeoxyribonuclease V, subunit B [Evansella caseinilytica]|uniref:ATP-dependent helicase/deoxyribonuclease subunit B n=1 Tax=Evansella caseinilytica TaxID=1503961 RepID=A0A1H3NR86_9BACI|nr:helicase-exonuclease AddAB subunit AddB [Evansella caseinilytica]SDY90689.1 DNA helicase/exodeoxyribonuclease V, subunit B [Evansella caseinilytica]
MSVTFYIGRSGTGKTYTMLQEIAKELQENPRGKPIIYLVPDQMTFQSEMHFVHSKLQGMTRLQVLSFSRLALRVLQETGGIARYHIQKSGMHMLLRKIVEQEKDNFAIFGRATDTNGFIEQLEQLFSEFKRYDVTPESLNEQEELLQIKAEKKPGELVLQDKMRDMRLIYSRLEQELAGQYVASDDYLNLLSSQIAKSDYLKHANVYIDGFFSFTPLEMKVLENLLLHCSSAVFSLTLDRAYDQQESLNELDLFFETAKTYQQLQAICEQHRLKATVTAFRGTKRFRSQALKHLEQYYDVRPAPVMGKNDGIRLIAAVHRRSEVEGVARQILRLVREESFRFRDMALLLRNMENYADLLETVFTDYRIPFFMDQKRSMLNHPVIEFIRSSLEIIQGHWRYEAVFRCLKTDLLFPLKADVSEMRERVDQLENYVLAYGIQGARWYQAEPWTYRRIRTSADGEWKRTAYEENFEQEINQLRWELTKPLAELEKQLKQDKSVRKRCETLYNFLQACRVPEKLEQMRNTAVENGDLQAAREHDQVWSAVVELLEQMVEMTGEETMPFSMFKAMLESGLESMKFSIIPPALDQVIVADMEHSRLSAVRCAFILGVNDGVIPAKPDEGGIMSEEERDQLQQDGMKLAPGSTRQLLNESFLIYMAQSTPAEQLYLTYPLADDEGRTLQPSIILKRIKDLCPTMTEQLWLQEPTDMAEAEQFQFINGPEKTLSYLTYQLQSWKKGYPVPDFWWDVYNWYCRGETWRTHVKNTLHSLFYTNKAEPLSRKTSAELYGEHLQTSVSRMELYQHCAFSQYANYGLSLKERDTFKLEAPDVGTLFHAALKELAELLRKQGRDFSNLSNEECDVLAKQIVHDLAPKIQREILLSSNRYHYIKQKLEEVVARASKVLSEQARFSGFSPVGLEVSFGPNQELPPLQFKLENGCTMELVGRIDRVDRSEGDNGVYLRIIDYKSSKKDVRLNDVYYGLALQMLIYLDVVVSFSEKWLGVRASPAGVLYFHVHNPLLQAKKKMTVEEVEEELFQQFKMKGLLAANPEVARLMDDKVDGGMSKIIPAGLKKNGEFYSNSSVISEQDYAALRKFLRNKVEEIGLAITEGRIDITPVKNKQQTACTFCSYKSFCQFDPTLETNDYNRVSKLEKAEILEQIRKKGEGENGDPA